MYGMDRKVLPLHLACAMQPPVEVIAALLRPDEALVTVKTPMKNHKKKVTMRRDRGGNNKQKGCSDLPPMSYPQQLILNRGDSCSFSDADPSNLRTVSMLSDDANSPNNNVDGSESTSINDDPWLPKNFFSDKENDKYVLQLTPTGEVKHISPNGKSLRTVVTESPFIHASASHEENPTNQAASADDFLPLHIACLFRASPAVIELLLKSYVEAVEYKNKWGMLPIHIVCANISLEPPIITASKMADDFTTKQYLNNLYADTTSDGARWELEKVVEMLVTVYPQSVTIPSDNIEWYTPLEYATRNLPNGDGKDGVISILNKEPSYRDAESQSLASSLTDSRVSTDIKAYSIGNSPLLYQYITSDNWDLVMKQIKKSPEEASYWVVESDYPRLPLHLACSHSTPLKIIKTLINAYPKALNTKDGSGSPPLHISCTNNLPLPCVHTIFESYPDAISMKDAIGRLPLHVACAHGASVEIIKMLIEAYPESCFIKDYNGHTALTYIDYCVEECTNKEEYYSLFARYEDRISLTSDDIGDSDENLE
jgi:ankyrin repeat protein